MKALILNSGLGHRMGALTLDHPKCMTRIYEMETILSRQLRMLEKAGIREIVMTTGPFADVMADYCRDIGLPLHIVFVANPKYRETNYIYSVYCARSYLDDDVLLMHGDLVFEDTVLGEIMASEHSCMVVSTTRPLPEKDFKAVIHGGHVEKVGINFFESAIAAQPLYRLKKTDWCVWLDNIVAFCERGDVNCYAEDALNEVTDRCVLCPLDVKDLLCNEIDNQAELAAVSARLRDMRNLN